MPLPPGPGRLGLVDSLRWAKNPFPMLSEFETEFGDAFTLWLSGIPYPIVVVSDPEVVREVFALGPDDGHAGKTNSVLAPLLGRHSLLTHRVPTSDPIDGLVKGRRRFDRAGIVRSRSDFRNGWRTNVRQVGTDRPRTPQAMFHRVAPYYDRMNSILSLGLDRRWRRQAAASLDLSPGARVLDVATGTGALATEIHRVTSGRVSITGCDLNDSMLAVARRRTQKAGAHVDLVRCDATSLPFAEESFDVITIGFAIDDMPDRCACANEMWRVLRSGGQLALLELGQPDAPLLKMAYRAYLFIFRLLRGGSLEGYKHLEREIMTYRGPDAVEKLLLGAGFRRYRRRSFAGGVARLHLAEKPLSSPVSGAA